MTKRLIYHHQILPIHVTEEKRTLVHVCIECKKPATNKAQTYDGQTIYLCDAHVKGWTVPKVKKIKAEAKQPQKTAVELPKKTGEEKKEE
jgi:hypothetical protein